MNQYPQNLSQLKKYMQVGTNVRMIWHRMKGECNCPRRVATVHTNAIIFEPTETSKGQPSWLHWGKASTWRFGSNTVTSLTPDGQKIFTYWFGPPIDPSQPDPADLDAPPVSLWTDEPEPAADIPQNRWPLSNGPVGRQVMPKGYPMHSFVCMLHGPVTVADRYTPCPGCVSMDKGEQIEQIRAIANNPDAPEQARQDAAVMLKWFGAEQTPIPGHTKDCRAGYSYAYDCTCGRLQPSQTPAPAQPVIVQTKAGPQLAWPAMLAEGQQLGLGL